MKQITTVLVLLCYTCSVQAGNVAVSENNSYVQISQMDSRRGLSGVTRSSTGINYEINIPFHKYFGGNVETDLNHVHKTNIFSIGIGVFLRNYTKGIAGIKVSHTEAIDIRRTPAGINMKMPEIGFNIYQAMFALYNNNFDISMSHAYVDSTSGSLIIMDPYAMQLGSGWFLNKNLYFVGSFGFIGDGNQYGLGVNYQPERSRIAFSLSYSKNIKDKTRTIYFATTYFFGSTKSLFYRIRRDVF